MAIYESQFFVISLKYMYSEKIKGSFIPVVVEFLVVVDPVVVDVVVWLGLRHSHFGSHRSGIIVAKITDDIDNKVLMKSE